MKVFLALAIFVTYGLQCYVAVDIAWNEYLGVKLEQNKRQLFWEYFTRTCLVLVTCKYLYPHSSACAHNIRTLFSPTGSGSTEPGTLHLPLRGALSFSFGNGVSGLHRLSHLLVLLLRLAFLLDDFQEYRLGSVRFIRARRGHLHQSARHHRTVRSGLMGHPREGMGFSRNIFTLNVSGPL